MKPRTQRSARRRIDDDDRHIYLLLCWEIQFGRGQHKKGEGDGSEDQEVRSRWPKAALLNQPPPPRYQSLLEGKRSKLLT